MKLAKFPYEYFLAQIIFVLKLQAYSELPFHKRLIEYTDIYSSLTGEEITDEVLDGKYNLIFSDFIQHTESLKTPKDITDFIYNLFLKQSHSQIEIGKENNQDTDDEKNFGCFAMSYNYYNKEKQRFKLHFKPKRIGLLETQPEKRVGDLASYYMNNRRSEFKQLLLFTKQDQFKDFKFLLSSTWLQNIPNYQLLFPPKYKLNENREKKDDSFLGLWGQFVKWDLTGNKATLDRFVENINNAQEYNEIIDAFPYPVYKILAPLDEMYDYWDI